eukprot:TRINITY_DN49948_c0_g1_i1.p1 TRINITY_DN49948_c0_g1~~TRINITY_DN49948_c0_g1_i1.p1  ORF type:complete len:186 (+),score=56.97 TRINITY_DN49948_c0_g1_i1:173-730(+)
MGVEVETCRKGDGKHFPSQGDTLTMHYTGTLAADGSQFDSSRDRGQPFNFTIGVGQVIKGWDEGVIQMSLGQRANLKISSDYGYGESGAGDKIPPGADLCFDVELLAINGKGLPSEEELRTYHKQLFNWMNKKISAYDSDKANRAKQNKKYGDRDGYAASLEKKIEAQIAEKDVANVLGLRFADE